MGPDTFSKDEDGPAQRSRLMPTRTSVFIANRNMTTDREPCI